MRDINGVQVGERLEAAVVESVDRQRMKTLAALYDDPNPIHFDIPGTEAAGMGDQLILQGAASIAIWLEPAIRWAGHPEAVRKYDVRLLGNVFAEDRVEATGSVAEVDVDAGTVTVELASKVGEREIAQGTAVLGLG
jgi:acyl dehydratase